MGYTYYSYLILVTPESDLTFEKLRPACEPLLKQGCENITVESDGLTFHFAGDYKFYLHLNAEPHVEEESVEMAAEEFVPQDKKAAVASCRIRYEMHADPDPDMEYFNESLYILEVLENFAGVFIIDPHSGDFL
jgi:hypothetical protein